MGLVATYAVHLRLIGKLVDDFLVFEFVVIIELFFAIGLRAEALRANMDWKSPF